MRLLLDASRRGTDGRLRDTMKKRITVVASYPGPGRLNLAFTPPIQTWRFPAHQRENDGRTAALNDCRDAVRRQSSGSGTDAPIGAIQSAVEAALEVLVEKGSIALP